jgi:nucleoside-diphosphate-sugar epimerase
MDIPDPIAIVGAGFVGRALADRLRDDGVEVITTTRSTAQDGDAIALDITRDSTEQIADKLAAARGIVLCYSSGGSQDRRQLFLEGGRRVLGACVRIKPARVIYTSSTSALPDRDAWLDEACEEWPTTQRGKIQREAEDLVAGTLGAANIPYVILRLAGLYGPGRDLGRIYRGDPGAVLAGDGMRPTNLIHRDDAVGSIVAALRLPKQTNALVQVCDDDHTPRREMMARVAATLGTGSPRWEADPAPDAQPRGKRVSNARMKQLLGLQLRYPEHLVPSGADKPPGPPD